MLLAALCVAAALSAGVTGWRLLDSPLRYDEAGSFGTQITGVITHGVPKVIENGKVVYGMWHPPLYQYNLAVFRLAFGPANWTARIVGIAWFVGTGLLLWRFAGASALCLALLSPLIAQGILFVDIDNTSMAFALILFGAVFATAPRPHSARTVAVLSAILFLALWSKLTTPFIMLIAVAVFHILNRDWRGLRHTAAIGAIATTAFFVSYFLYCDWTGYPPRFMFDFTYIGKRGAYLSLAGRSLVEPLHAIWWNVIWFSPALALLFGVLTFERLRAFWQDRRAESIDFWVIFAWVCFGAYAVWAGVMGKYTFPAGVSAAMALGLWLPGLLSNVRVRKPAVLAIAGTALLIFHVLALPALQVKPSGADASALTLAAGLTHPRTIALALVVGSFAAFALVVSRAIAGTAPARIAVTLLVCAIVANSVETFKVMLSADDRSPYRPFEERGFEATVRRLNQDLAPTDTIIGPKDFVYYFRGRSYRLDGIRYSETGEADVVETIRRSGITHAVDSAANPILDSDRLFREAGLQPVDRVGDFVIYGLAR